MTLDPLHTGRENTLGLPQCTHEYSKSLFAKVEPSSLDGDISKQTQTHTLRQSYQLWEQ